MATVKLDGLDLYPFLRVAQGEGLDPVDPDHVAPQFADAAAGEGDPLLSVHAGNREMIFPLSIRPSVAVGYADTTDGLSQLVRDLNRACAAASTLEWADEGATVSTFYDVTFARLEIAYDYRLKQQRWLKANLHVWAKPYGHTGTTRILGTAVATINPMTDTVLASGMDGDAATDLDVIVSYCARGGSYPASGPLFAGFSVLDGKATSILRPAASLQDVPGVATFAGASGAAGSQMKTWNLGPLGTDGGQIVFAVSGLDFIPAQEGLRVLALARNRGATTVHMWAANFNAPSSPLGPTQVLEAGKKWRVIDLGVTLGDRSIGISACDPAGSATTLLDLSAVLYLPEARTVAMHTPQQGNLSVATHFFGGTTAPVLGKVEGGTGPLGQQVRDVTEYQRGVQPKLIQGASQLVQAFAIPDDGPHNPAAVGVDIRVRERFTFTR